MKHCYYCEQPAQYKTFCIFQQLHFSILSTISSLTCKPKPKNTNILRYSSNWHYRKPFTLFLQGFNSSNSRSKKRTFFLKHFGLHCASRHQILLALPSVPQPHSVTAYLIRKRRLVEHIVSLCVSHGTGKPSLSTDHYGERKQLNARK